MKDVPESVVTEFSYFLPLVVSIGLFFAAVRIFRWISPQTMPQDNTQGNNFGANNPQFHGSNNAGGNQFQGSISGPMNFGNIGNTTRRNTQIGGGGNNPQVQGNIVAGTGGIVNLGVQRGNVNSRKDLMGDQVSGGDKINAGGGDKINTGTQG